MNKWWITNGSALCSRRWRVSRARASAGRMRDDWNSPWGVHPEIRVQVSDHALDANQCTWHVAVENISQHATITDGARHTGR